MANFAEAQSRLLILKHGDFQEAVLYRLQKGWKLHFILDASLTSLPVKVFVNHPIDPREGPDRDKYREVLWTNESPLRSDNYDSYAEVPIVLAGSFNYFFTTDGSTNKKQAVGGGYFLVDPVLLVGKMDDRMSLNSICCHTVMPKLLGTFDQWPDRLRVSKESGYNMIHFTPVQELGNSNSAYCLRDQRRLDPRYSTKDRTYSMEDLRGLVDIMKNDWNVLSLTDLVYNHTANESRWILENPDCSYNMINSPHLKPAYLMDRILWHFSIEVGAGRWEHRGIPSHITEESQLSAIRWVLKNEVMPRHRFWEFHQCHVEDVVSHYRTTILAGARGDDKPASDIHLIPDQNFRRLKCQIDISQAIKNFYSSQPPFTPRDDQLNNACEGLRKKLRDMNSQGAAVIMDHINCAVDNFVANARWRFVDGNGPRLGKVGPDSPLMWNYFTLPKMTSVEEEEDQALNTDFGAFCMAHNGWVMSDDPLRNFAEPGSNVYLRRELIPWGDSVKLRYGRKPEDSPFLWNYMKDYTVEAATIFHGVRLDNCHSTPVHVAQFMLDEARKARPDLYVIAELFTNSEYADNTFINKLGINSLIREGLNGFNPRELSRLVHRYAGDPVGSFVQLNSRYLMPSTAHALFMDQTHDNESVIQKHTAEDLLPYSATIAMTCSAFGSNRGYDEMVPHYIDVVNEKRLYKSWTVDEDKAKSSCTRLDTGIIRAKKILNELHALLEKAKFQEAFVNMVTDDIISVTRHNPTSHQSLILFAHTSFFPNDRGGHRDHVNLPGVVEGIIFEGTLRKTGEQEFKRDSLYINGIDNYELDQQENVEVSQSRIMTVVNPGDQHNSLVEFHGLVPGSVIIMRVNLPISIRPQILGLRKVLTGFGYQMKTLSSRRVSVLKHPLQDIFEKMNLDDLHRVLFRSDQEERDDGLGFGAYGLTSGQLKYCGLQGIVTLLDSIRPSNDLGHPLCQNLREGNWLMDYVVNRLVAHERTKNLGEWFREAFYPLKKLPRYLIPAYFDAIVYGVYTLAVEYCWQKMSTFAGSSSKFVRDLSLGSVQLCSYVKTAKLPKLSKNLAKPHPPRAKEGDIEVEACLTLSAGLPHFSTGLFRNWGRDTFIAIRGLLLLTGRFEEARFIILGYAGTLRHGLIPNLLGEGLSARYNCRDAVWFWLQCIKDYCLLSPHGTGILNDEVMRLYPYDHSEVTMDKDQKLHEIMQEALQKHATGLKFRERNAGHKIDSEMLDKGFDNEIGVNWETGFVFGGNEYNCGTWMDKMGSSSKAGNKGIPATPRDGSAVEIVGLSASVIDWLDEVSSKGIYPHKGVQRKTSPVFEWKDWFDLIQKNFEAYFWIDQGKVDQKYHQRDLINRVKIYKDSVGSSRKYTDYQLRCNFPIAMAVCPNLFTPEKAWEALLVLEKYLLGPLGVKTLDPSDYNYVGDYYNSDDSDDYKRARGFNYHQGPEWVWPIGYFLRAKLAMAQKLAAKRGHSILEETVSFVEKKLTAHNNHLQMSEWRSLPELTNSNGSHCPDSCMAQAWSVGCLLEVLYEMSSVRSSIASSSSPPSP